MTTTRDGPAGPDAQGSSRVMMGTDAMAKGCRQYAVELSAYFDDELEGDALERIESHLAKCDACRDTLARLRKLRAALHQFAKPSGPGRSILEDLKARMEEEGGLGPIKEREPPVS